MEVMELLESKVTRETSAELDFLEKGYNIYDHSILLNVPLYLIAGIGCPRPSRYERNEGS